MQKEQRQQTKVPLEKEQQPRYYISMYEKQEMMKETKKEEIIYYTPKIAKHLCKKEWQAMIQYPVVTDLKVYLDNFKEPNILQILSLKCKFPNLIDLSLNSNHIESIEPLQIMFMPNLQKIDLSNNYITSFDAIRKCNIPCIRQIDFCNPYNQQIKIKFIQRLHQLNSPKLNRIYLFSDSVKIRNNILIPFRAKNSHVKLIKQNIVV